MNGTDEHTQQKVKQGAIQTTTETTNKTPQTKKDQQKKSKENNEYNIILNKEETQNTQS
jgi:hypothetical protein